jgi:hypothetical protein
VSAAAGLVAAVAGPRRDAPMRALRYE